MNEKLENGKWYGATDLLEKAVKEREGRKKIDLNT